MKRAYITYAKRTPIGKIGGRLAPVRVDDLMAVLLSDFARSAPFDLLEIDDIVVGCANQAGEDNRNIARMAGLLAKIPDPVPGVTVNRLCGSSLDALIDACGRISLNLAECLLVGGVEGMTRAPLVVSKGSSAFGRDSKMYDSTFGWRFPNPKMRDLFPLWSMGETAEHVAEKFLISREEQDRFALQSHQKALVAQQNKAFENEMVPVPVELKKKGYTVDADEGPRPDTSLEKLAKLPPVFRQGGTVTAGNASTMNDGAALLTVVSERFLKKHNLVPLAEVTGFGVRGVHPNVMGLGPVQAVEMLCRKYAHKTSDFDVVELNEAFAAQALACLQKLDLDPQKTNLRGGAIALGHPLGCSGARIATTLIHIMRQNPSLKKGLATMCVGVGQGVAVSVERA